MEAGMTDLSKKLRRCALAGFALCIMTTTSYAWTNSEGEEDWGETCFLEQTHQSGYIQILTQKGFFDPALLISHTDYPGYGSGFSVNFNLSDGTRFERSGRMDDYFGMVYVELDRTRFDRLSANQSVTIYYPGASVYVPLGRSDAFSEFLRCAGELAQNDGANPASKPAGSFWKKR